MLAVFPWALAAALPASELVVVSVILGEGTLGPRGIEQRVAVSMDARAQLRFVSDDEVFVRGREALTEDVIRCGADVSCQARALRGASRDLGLVVVLNYLIDPPFLDVRLIDIRNQRLRASNPGSVEPGRPVARALTERVEGVLDSGGYPRAGHLAVKATPSSAALRLRGLPPLAGAHPEGWLLRPGAYVIQGTRAGFQDAEVEVDVAAGRERVLLFQLDPAPSRGGPAPWVWWAVGGGAALLAGSVAAVVALATHRDCICVGAECPSCS